MAVRRTEAVRTVELTKRFGEVIAVDAVSLEVPAGQLFGLIGPNGAGKSTMIKMLTTLLSSTRGRAWVAGFDVTTQPAEVRRRIGYVPQLLSADGALTGYENLLVSARLYGVDRATQGRRIHEALDLMGLKDAAHTLVRAYSGGMIRRLEIAQGMLHRPSVLFMDEPTVGLDPVARRTVWAHVRELQSLFGTTMVLTTHYMEEVEALCKAVAIIHQGRIVAMGSPAELKAPVGAGASLDDVFVHFTGAAIEAGGGYREVRRTRRTAQALS
ncbi:MAG: ATP-binding cassette domain-containing protein [candidate division NC10 bacterium]|nr:ATP-binding cassette domain-containing protein [candidate division NC10 bacterium]MDE2322174.1 ATP-binding cassette domain-containing protein [candidate division NC10 bacterium]